MTEQKKSDSKFDRAQVKSSQGPRRSFLTTLGLGLVGASAVVFGTRFARADGGVPNKGAEKCTDADVGTYADPANGGRSCGSSCTDTDTGTYADPVNGGRRCAATSCTDTDTGTYADPVNGGRSCGGGSYTCITDRDTGCGADPVCR